MRKLISALVVALAISLSGCVLEEFRPFRDRRGTTDLATEVPSAKHLVDYLNDNASRVDTVVSRDISLTCYYKLIPPMGLNAKLVCEKPRNLRLAAYSQFGNEVDLGSNPQEFWWWIKRGDPYQFFCSYKDLEEGRVRVVPFPFQPEWMMEAMGIGDYGTPEMYLPVKAEKDVVKLVRRTRSPQGKPVLKVIVFNRRPTSVDKGMAQVVQHVLIEEGTNKELCSAQITQVQVDPSRGGVLPKVMHLNWPAERLKLTMNFDKLVVNSPISNRDVFVRNQIRDVQPVDLARIGPPSPGLQRVQGQNP
jgi:hypothetical protein